MLPIYCAGFLESMAKIVVARGSQQEEMRRLHPKPYYSRVVMIGFDVPAGPDTQQWDITAKLGQNLWLLNVQFWYCSKTDNSPVGICWRIVECVQAPENAGQIAVKLRPVIDFYFYGKPYMFSFGQQKHYSFDMARFYEGQPRRFALWVQNNSVPVVQCQASFLISEG